MKREGYLARGGWDGEIIYQDFGDFLEIFLPAGGIRVIIVGEFTAKAVKGDREMQVLPSSFWEILRAGMCTQQVCYEY